VTRADAAYAALWIVVIAARSCFSIGAVHWFNHPLATWMTNHQLTGAAITDTLIIMAVAMTLARTLCLDIRANEIRRYDPVAHECTRPEVDRLVDGDRSTPAGPRRGRTRRSGFRGLVLAERAGGQRAATCRRTAPASSLAASMPSKASRFRRGSTRRFAWRRIAKLPHLSDPSDRGHRRRYGLQSIA